MFEAVTTGADDLEDPAYAAAFVGRVLSEGDVTTVSGVTEKRL